MNHFAKNSSVYVSRLMGHNDSMVSVMPMIMR